MKIFILALLLLRAQVKSGNPKICFAPVLCSLGERSVPEWIEIASKRQDISKSCSCSSIQGCSASVPEDGEFKENLKDVTNSLTDVQQLNTNQTQEILQLKQELAEVKQVNEENEESLNSVNEKIIRNANWLNALTSIQTLYKATNHYHYFLGTSKTNYANARDTCVQYGATLATVGIKSSVIRGELTTQFSSYPFWIGLDDIKTEGSWAWLDGTASTASNTAWQSGEPNNLGNEDCAEITSSSGRLNDDSCDENQNFLCEAKYL